MARRLLDLPLLVLLIGLVALAMWVPASHAVVTSDHRTARAFFYSGLMLLMLVAMLGIATAHLRPRNPMRANLTGFLLAYPVLPVAMALPLHQGLRDTHFINAWFEMVLAFTTTGGSVYDLGRLTPSMELWRALAGWLGGLHILVGAIAVLAPMNLGGLEVISGRVPGRSTEGLGQIVQTATPERRMAQQAAVVFPAYAGLTAALWLVLVMAGEGSLVALCHAMATLSTTASSPSAGLTGMTSGHVGEVAIFLGLTAALTRRAWPGLALYDRGSPLWRDPELRFGLAIVAVVPIILFLRHWIVTGTEPAGWVPALQALWGGAFTTLSFLTTTGFTSADWSMARGWSGLGSPGLVLAGLAIFGGGIATTAGGVKLLRVYALFRHGEREMERLVHPSSVGGSGNTLRRLRGEGARLAWIFFILFACALAVSAAALTLVGVAFEPALVLSIAALTSTGPLADMAGSVPFPYAALGPEAKLVLALVMMLGRVELLAVLALLSPDAWRG